MLSACETRRERLLWAKVIGMSWALFVAGKLTTVVSPWSRVAQHNRADAGVSPQSLSSVSKADALQRAAIKMLRTRQYRHPFYWAGFSISHGN